MLTTDQEVAGGCALGPDPAWGVAVQPHSVALKSLVRPVWAPTYQIVTRGVGVSQSGVGGGALHSSMKVGIRDDSSTAELGTGTDR